MRLPFRLRVWRELLRLRLLYAWRRDELGRQLPTEPEPDTRGAPLPGVQATEGVYRPPFRSQFGDSSESHSSPHSEGSNCTMSSAAMALAYHVDGSGSAAGRRGGDMRHAQGDQDGGTDLYDAAEAFAHNGESLSIRSGQGWSAVVDALEAGRGVILQGTGGLTGCGDYTGGHAVYVNPEASGSRWLKGDPECSGWEWTEASSLKAFAQRLSSSVYFAVTAAHAAPAPTPPPTPEPDCPDCPDCPDPQPLIDQAVEVAVDQAGDAAVVEWVDWLTAGASTEADEWDAGSWDAPELGLDELLEATGCELVPSHWARGPIPDPVSSAYSALVTPSVWDGGGSWRAILWAA